MGRPDGAAGGQEELPASSTFGHYVIDEKLGEGATGVVYRATDTRDETIVALKVLRRVLVEHSVYLRRFWREAEIAREVRHRHLVSVVDVGEHAGHPFLAAVYFPGGSLQRHIRSLGSLSVVEALRVTGHVASALDALAARGLVHRDVKPGNVMLDGEGNAALTDFGLARGPAHTVLTRVGQPLGTIEYMAPEIIRGETATQQSEIYALGCLVFTCLAGRSPFSGGTSYQVAHGHLSRTPPDLRELRPELPAHLADTVVRALAKDPAARPRTATAYANLLEVAAR